MRQTAIAGLDRKCGYEIRAKTGESIGAFLIVEIQHHQPRNRAADDSQTAILLFQEPMLQF